MKKFSFLIFIMLFSACTNMRVVQVDPVTGYFKTNTQATTILGKDVDLDSMKSLLLVMDHDFIIGQIKNIGYFESIITFEDLEKEIVKNNLQEKVPNVDGRIGLNNAYKEYKPFLWFRYDFRGTGSNEYAQFILTDPGTLEDIFIAEIKLDFVWSGVNDQSTWYPLFNELIKYINSNSETYKNNITRPSN